MRQIAHANQFQRFHDPVFQLGLRTLGDFQWKTDVVKHAHVRPDRIILKNDADAPNVWRNINSRRRVRYHLIVNQNPPGIRRFKTGNHSEQYGFAAT